MVFRFLHSVFASAPSEPGKYDKTLMLAAIERVVDGTDPRLRAVSHYRRKLWDPVERSIDFVVTLVRTLPPTVTADRQGYMSDPRLRALFASPEHMREILSFSDGTRHYLQRHASPLPGELYAALGAIRVERNVLGIEMDGEILRRDVPQTTVNFCDHRLGCFTDNERDTHRELMKLTFDYLVHTALQDLTSSRVQRAQLEQQQRQLLQKKADLLKQGRMGLASLAEPATPEADLAALEQQIEHLETELGQLRADSATLEQHLVTVATILGEPERYLRLDPVSLTLDHTNTRVAPDSSQVANSMTFDDVVLGSDRRVTALFVRFPSSELLPQPDFFEEANRLLNSAR